MASDKIQSGGSTGKQDGLTIQLKDVPKLLGDVRRWAPKAYLVSFKLETDTSILMSKAQG